MSDKMAAAWRAAWTKPDRRPIWEWASEELYLGNAYAVQGRFNVEISRHLIDPFRAVQNDRVRMINVLKPTRGAGTMFVDISLAWLIANDPGMIQFNFQSQPIAKDHAQRRFFPLLQTSRQIREKYPTNHDLITNDSILFRDGMAVECQGPSIGNLQSKGVRYSANDEGWIWPDGRLAEAHARTGDFDVLQTSKTFNISQGGNSDTDWWRIWHERNRRYDWNVQCAKCGHYMPIKFTGKRDDGTKWGMCWAKDAKDVHGKWNVRRVLETLRFECRACAHGHVDSPLTLRRWNESGRYECENPEASEKRVGYHWNAFIVRRWDEIVERWLMADAAMKWGSFEPMKKIIQKDFAEFWNGSGGQADEVPTASYDIATAKAGAKVFMTIDRQVNHYWYLVRSFTGSESHLMKFGQAFTEEELVDVQKSFNIPSNMTAMDVSYEETESLRICAKHGWTALKGHDLKTQRLFKHTGNVIKNGAHVVETFNRLYAPREMKDPWLGTPMQGRQKVAYFLWVTETTRDIVGVLRSGKGIKWVAPHDIGDEYRKQVWAERKREEMNKKTGRSAMRWVQVTKDNHAFDCECMAIVMASMLQLVPVDIAEAEGDTTAQA